MLMRRHEAGVTLIEMLVVVTIIALFTTLVGPRIIEHLEKAKRVAARVQINNFEQDLVQYKLDTGIFPTTDQGIEALRSRPANVDHWDSTYLVNENPLAPECHPHYL